MNKLCDECRCHVLALDVDDLADLIEDLNDAFDGEYTDEGETTEEEEDCQEQLDSLKKSS